MKARKNEQAISAPEFKLQHQSCVIKTFDSGTYTATYEPGVFESSNAAIPGTLSRWTIPLEKSRGSKNCTSFVAIRHATASSELNRIDGLKNRTKQQHYSNWESNNSMPKSPHFTMSISSCSSEMLDKPIRPSPHSTTRHS